MASRGGGGEKEAPFPALETGPGEPELELKCLAEGQGQEGWPGRGAVNGDGHWSVAASRDASIVV